MARVPGVERSVDSVSALLVAVCPAALLVLAGPVGAAIGVLAAVVWLTGPVFGFAAAQFGLVLVVEVPVAPLRLAALQVAVGSLLVAGLADVEGSARVGGLFVVLAILLGGGALGAIDAGVGTVEVAAALVGVVAVSGYLLHRYELVALGLVQTEPDADGG